MIERQGTKRAVMCQHEIGVILELLIVKQNHEDGLDANDAVRDQNNNWHK